MISPQLTKAFGPIVVRLVHLDRSMTPFGPRCSYSFCIWKALVDMVCRLVAWEKSMLHFRFEYVFWIELPRAISTTFLPAGLVAGTCTVSVG